MMEPERLHLIFERSPEEPRLLGVDDVIRALGQNNIEVAVAAQNRGDDGFFARLLRFWFPYLSREGVIGVTPDAATEAGEFIVTLAPELGPGFGAALGAWVQDQHGRNVRVKLDDIEIEAQTPEQVELLQSRLEGLRQNRKPARSGEK